MNNDDQLSNITKHEIIVGTLVFILIVAFVATVLQPLVGSF